MKNFLIISVNAIGDTYLSLSAANKIKNTFPDSEIDMVIDAKSNFLMSDLEFINNTITNHDLLDFFDTLLEINKKYYDYVFNFFPGRLNTIFNVLSRSKVKVGYWNIFRLVDWSSTNQRVRSNLQNGKSIVWRKNSNYLERINMVFRAINFNLFLESKLTFLDRNDNPIRYKDYFLLHTASRIRNRSLNEIQIKSLLNYLLNKFDNKIIFICSHQDENIKFIKSLESDRVKIFENLTLTDLVQTINFSRLFFAVDSFPIHLADAYNGSFLGLFGPTNPSSVLQNGGKSIRFDVDCLQNVSEEIFIKTIENKIYKANLI